MTETERFVESIQRVKTSERRVKDILEFTFLRLQNSCAEKRKYHAEKPPVLFVIFISLLAFLRDTHQRSADSCHQHL